MSVSGVSFLPLSVEAERAARRCEFYLDHIKQWAIFIWEPALCTVGKTEHWAAPQKKKTLFEMLESGTKINVLNNVAEMFTK